MQFLVICVVTGSTGNVDQQEPEHLTHSTDNLDSFSTEHTNGTEESMEVDNVSMRVEVPFADPHVIVERSILDPPPSATPITDRPVEFELIAGGTQRGKDLLVDSRGYAYNVKVKDLASKDVFKSARTITEEVSDGVTGITNVEPFNPEYIARAANRYRQELRPEDPDDLNFELNEGDFPPHFLRDDIRVGEKRHLIFASEQQLDLLRQARRWYIDGTFKVAREPFTQLLSIHAFVRRGDCSKQVPLVYIFMSRRTTVDYVKVLQAVGRLLKGQCVVEGFVADFEMALWKALRYVFEGADIRGCAFHWGQAVWKHVVKLGLSTQYTQDVGTYCYIRKLLCLPFLPPEHIQPTFDALCDLNSADHLKPFLQYIENTWIQSSTWPVTSWSVFGQSVRTNNDVEGWHRKINGRAGSSPAFHLLVRVLYQESRQMVNLVQLVSEMKLRRVQRKSTRAVQAKVFALWDRYLNEGLSTTRLLKEMSQVYRHRVTTEDSGR